MNNADFWKSVRDIIAEGFTPKGLQMLDYYAELFISGRLVYQRFSPLEQHGCATGGETHVIASLLAGAEDSTDSVHSAPLNDFQRECQRGAKQEEYIERWAHAVGCWNENVDDLLSASLGEKIAEGGEAIVYDQSGSTLRNYVRVEPGNSQQMLTCEVGL